MCVQMILKILHSNIFFVSAGYHEQEDFHWLKDEVGAEYVVYKPIDDEGVAFLFETICNKKPKEKPENDFLSKLKEQYKATIPEKWQMLHDLIKSLSEDPADEKSLKALRQELHKISGSAGTYGFPKASDLCRHAEKEIVLLLKDSSPISSQLLSYFQNLFLISLFIL